MPMPSIAEMTASFQKVLKVLGSVEWGFSGGLTDEDAEVIKNMLKKDFYIILTRRSNHLSTYLITISDFFLTGKLGYWAHALMNTEGDDVNNVGDFRLQEAIGSGVQYSPFADVFNVHSVALLKPKSMTVDKWTAVLSRLPADLGKPYDTLFDLKNADAVSCVEMVRDALRNEPNYETDFANFETMIKTNSNLTPQMFYDCPDFEIALEIRR